MGCCSDAKASVPSANRPIPNPRKKDDGRLPYLATLHKHSHRSCREGEHFGDERPAGKPMTQEEIEARRKIIAEQSEKRAAEHAQRGLTKEGQIEMQAAEERQKKVEKYEREQGRTDDFQLQYKT